jgi:hypothetical protein
MSYYKKFVPLLAGMMLVLLLAAGFISLKSKSPDRANFSGDWKLNKSKSDFGRMDVFCNTDYLYAFTIMKIDGQEGFLIVDEGGPSPEGTLVTRQEKLTFDGRESEASLFRNTKKKSTVKWSDDGQTMTVNSVITYDLDGEKTAMKVTEVWKLINGGKSISLQFNSNSTSGENAMRLVYDRTN